jgi:hypothetical protein
VESLTHARFNRRYLEQTYYGNTISQWLQAFGLILLSIILGRLIYWVLGNWFKALTRKTETRIDDLLVDLLKEPAVGIFVLFGVQLALSRLSLNEQWGAFFENAVVFAIALLVAWPFAFMMPSMRITL